jgi:hypothetical protein
MYMCVCVCVCVGVCVCVCIYITSIYIRLRHNLHSVHGDESAVLKQAFSQSDCHRQRGRLGRVSLPLSGPPL